MPYMKPPYEFSLDVKQKIGIQPITIIQDDTKANIFQITIKSDGEPIDLTGNTVTITLKKQDENVVVGNCTIVDALKGIVSYTLGSNDISYVGSVTFSCEVYGTGGTRISTFPAKFKVVADLDNGSSVPSLTEYTVLTSLINDFNTATFDEAAQKTYEQERKEAETLRESTFSTMQTSATNATNAANTATSNANTATSAANSAATSATNAAASANTATTNAINATNNAIEATNDAVEATSSAITATNSANEATNRANTSASNADAATTRANTATTNANNATTSANNAASSANTAAANANTATVNTVQATDDANEVISIMNTKIAESTSATSAANTATSNANSATASANTAANNANTAATNATNTVNGLNTTVTNAETLRQSQETTRQNQESTRQSNETTRQSQETTRQNNEGARVQKLQRITEDMILTKSYTEPINMATVQDGSNRITKRTFTRADGSLSEIVERGSFDANNNPQNLTRKTYDQYQKGTNKTVHTVAYNTINEATSDTAVVSPYDKDTLLDTRNSVAINPLNSFNYTGGTSNANVFINDGQIGTSQLVNDISALEVHGQDIYTTYTDGKVNNITNTGSVYVGGDTADLEYDFSYKVANSTAECPMKIYKQEVSDIANLPSPTVNYTNAITNGDFSSGMSWWTVNTGATASVTNNEATLQITSTNASIGIYTSLNTIVGNKYYIAFNTFTKYPNESRIMSSVYKNTTANTWTPISCIYTATATPTTVTFYHNASTSYVVGDTLKVKNMMAINLTALFGSGNEPTSLAWCDTYLPFVATTGTTMMGWQEITSQSVLDRLKSQNELLVSSIASDKSSLVWNSKTLSKTTTLKVVDDFVGKVSGSVVENPNKSYSSLMNTLQTPNNITGDVHTGFVETTQANYDLIKTLDSNCRPSGTGAVGQIPQILLSWNIIDIIERRFGAIPKETLSEKIAWAINNIPLINCNVYAYGSNPTGNKVYLDMWEAGAWARNSSYQNTSSSPTLISRPTLTTLSTRIDSNGFIHGLLSTDSARTTDSTLLVLTGHGLSVSDVIENVTRDYRGSLSTMSANTIATNTVTGQTGGDIINKYHYLSYQHSATGTTTTTVVITNHGLSTGDFIKNETRAYALRKVTVIDANTFTVDAITGQTIGDAFYLYRFTGTQTAESTVIPSTIYLDYASVEITLKSPESMVTADVSADIVTDFTGKVSGSVAENANVAKEVVTSSLNAPNGTWLREFISNSDAIKTLNNSSYFTGTSTTSSIPQQLFSFNIISAVEKQLGMSIPSADKVQWCKDNIYKITCDYYGYGVCPTGNIAKFAVYENGGWTTRVDYITTSTVSNTSIGIDTDINSRLQSDGFVHFLAYTDPARTTDSTLLVLTGHGLSTGDVIENITHSGFSSITTNTLNANVLSLSTGITGQVSGDVINKYRYTQSKVAETGTTQTNIKITGHGLATGDYVRNASRGATKYKITVVNADNFTIVGGSSLQTVGDSILLYPYLGQQTAENTVISSTIYTDFVKLSIKLKYLPSYDFFTDTVSQRRDAGLTDIVLVKRNPSDMVMDYSGKVSGSVVENPHVSKRSGNSSLLSPSSFSTEIGSSYSLISSLDGNMYQPGFNTSGNIAQNLFSFNIIAGIEKALGRSLQGATLADKIANAKDMLSLIRCDWTGFGSCPSGNKAYLSAYYSSWNTPTSNVASSPSLLTSAIGTSNIPSYIQSDGFIHFLAYTDASDGTTASVINTDYVKLTLTFKTDTTGYTYFDNNSIEISVNTNQKYSAMMVEIDLSKVATDLYSGSNSALKSALKKIIVDLYGMATGANGSSLGYGFTGKVYSSYTSSWLTWSTLANNNSNIAFMEGQTSDTSYLQSTNKLYIIAYSNYKSDTFINSEVVLDYINVKVQLSRTPDVISNPPQVYLPSTWSLLVKGFSPKWDSTDSKEHRIVGIAKDSNNSFTLRKTTSNTIEWYKYINPTINTLPSSVISFSKYKIYNILIQQSASGSTMYILGNNGVVSKYTDSNLLFVGNSTLYMMARSDNTLQADAFMQKLVFMPNKTFTDNEASVILKGRNDIDVNDSNLNALATQYASQEMIPLFSDSKWVKHANATVSTDGKTLTLNATSNYNGTYIDLPVLPNNQYEIKSNITSGGYIQTFQYYNNIGLDSGVYSINNPTSTIVTTTAKTNKLRISVTNRSLGAGTFTFSNISLKIKM